MVLTITLPFVFFMYNVVPQDVKVWNTKWFTLQAGEHGEVNYYVWIQFIKFLTISLLSLWYISCSYWWRNILFIPIIFEFNKVFGNIYYANYYVDENEFWFALSLLISIPYIVLLYFIAKKFKYYIPNRTINNELNKEINQQITKLSKFNSKDYKVIKRQLKSLMKIKNNLSKKEYLTQLIVLRDRLSID